MLRHRRLTRVPSIDQHRAAELAGQIVGNEAVQAIAEGGFPGPTAAQDRSQGAGLDGQREAMQGRARRASVGKAQVANRNARSIGRRLGFDRDWAALPHVLPIARAARIEQSPPGDAWIEEQKQRRAEHRGHQHVVDEDRWGENLEWQEAHDVKAPADCARAGQRGQDADQRVFQDLPGSARLGRAAR